MSRGAKVFLRTTAPPRPGAPIAEQFRACVWNTGNYFFEESLLRQLAGVQVCDGLDALPRRISTLVLSMSNFISPTTDLGYLYEALQERRVEQVVMIGAGAQAYEYGEAIHLTPGTRRFLGFVAERSRTIGVRGCYTADVLRRLGIRNVDVVGCPSAFWAGAPDLDGTGRLPDRPRLAMHSTPLGHYRDKVSALMAHGMRHGADYILQSETWMMPLLAAEGDPALLEENLLYYAYPECDPARLRSWLERRLLAFFGMQQWLDHLRPYDFVYGSRFHGNMAAIQAGVPALNMPYDTRTRELCEYLNLPMLPLEDFDASIPPSRLRELADFSLYRRTYKDKLGAYTSFFTRNGLAHTLGRVAAPPGPAASPGWAVKLASLRRLVSDLEASDGCSPAALHSAVTQRLRCDRDAQGRVAAEEGRFGDVGPSLHVPASDWRGQGRTEQGDIVPTEASNAAASETGPQAHDAVASTDTASRFDRSGNGKGPAPAAGGSDRPFHATPPVKAKARRRRNLPASWKRTLSASMPVRPPPSTHA